VKQIVKKYVLLFCGIAFLGGCAEWRQNDWEGARLLEPVVVFPSFNSNYILSCLSDMQTLERKSFDVKFELAVAGLQHGRDLDKLRFICLSLNEKADYKQFKHGTKVLEQYFEDHPDSGEDLQGFKILVERLDEEILNRWSAWKSLLNDKKELKAEIESLKVSIEELQKQIEQLKNIENIIKSRETKQP
jgi:hypothetical protein